MGDTNRRKSGKREFISFLAQDFSIDDRKRFVFLEFLEIKSGTSTMLPVSHCRQSLAFMVSRV